MKIKLGIIIHKMYGGGAERVASMLSLYLDESKYEKTVMVFDDSKKGYNFSGEIIGLNTKPSKNIQRKFLNIFKRILLVSKIKKKKDLDITISLLSGPNLINLLTFKNGKRVISVRNYLSESSKGIYGSIHRYLVKALYNKADLIVVVSEAIKQDLVSNYGVKENKIKVIYNFYDIKKIQIDSKEELEEKYKKIFDKPVVITAGRLVEQKAQWHLIRAFKKVKDEIPNAQLVILGEGKLEGYLKDLTLKLGLNNNIHFLGFQKNPCKYIKNSSVYVLPSLYEGFPNALCEAMGAGIPIISTDCPSGPKEILLGNVELNTSDNFVCAEFGILTPNFDGVQYDHKAMLTKEELIMAEAIELILTDKSISKKYSLKSTKRVKDFEVKTKIKEWEKVIQTLGES